jgi:hypothetical protein
VEVKTYEAMKEYHQECSSIRPPSEQSHRDKRILSHLGLTVYERDCPDVSTDRRVVGCLLYANRHNYRRCCSFFYLYKCDSVDYTY